MFIEQYSVILQCFTVYILKNIRMLVVYDDLPAQNKILFYRSRTEITSLFRTATNLYFGKNVYLGGKEDDDDDEQQY